jgi:hypothetical protein
MLLGKMDVHMQETESKPYLSPCIKINSKWSKGLNEKFETTIGKQRKHWNIQT